MYEKKTDIKVNGKESVLLFCAQKYSTHLSLIIEVLEKRCGGEKVLINGIRGKILKCINMWILLFRQLSIVKITRD